MSSRRTPCPHRFRNPESTRPSAYLAARSAPRPLPVTPTPPPPPPPEKSPPPSPPPASASAARTYSRDTKQSRLDVLPPPPTPHSTTAGDPIGPVSNDPPRPRPPVNASHGTHAQRHQHRPWRPLPSIHVSGACWATNSAFPRERSLIPSQLIYKASCAFNPLKSNTRRHPNSALSRIVAIHPFTRAVLCLHMTQLAGQPKGISAPS
jgi:hypothetical protein